MCSSGFYPDACNSQCMEQSLSQVMSEGHTESLEIAVLQVSYPDQAKMGPVHYIMSVEVSNPRD